MSEARNHEERFCGWCGTMTDHHTVEHEAARSPQGEDHEAGIEAAADPIEESYGYGGPDDLRAQRRAKAVEVAERAIAAYLSRCPSPDRDTEKEN